MTDVLLKERPTSSKDMLDLIQNTQNSYMIQYYMRSYPQTLSFIKNICENFGSHGVANLAPIKLIDDFTKASEDVALKHGPPYMYLGTEKITSFTAPKPSGCLIPTPKVVVVFGPYIGDFNSVQDQLYLMLKSHEVRIVLYLAYKNTPYNKMHVF